MLKFVAFFWIAFDVAICLRTGYMSGPFSRAEWWGWLFGGGALALFALIAEHFGHKADRKEAADLREKLTKQEGFVEGAFVRMDHRLEALGRVSDRVAAQDDKSGGRLREELSQLKIELDSIKGVLNAAPPRSSGLRDRLGPVLKWDSSRAQVHLLVSNQDPQAEFYGIFDIAGPVSADRQSRLFCKWAHTASVRTKIARGQTCEIFLAELKWDTQGSASTARWEIYAVSESGPRTITPLHSSMALPEVHPAEDIVLTGRIFADPDLPLGPLPFRVILKPFGPELGELGNASSN